MRAAVAALLVALLGGSAHAAANAQSVRDEAARLLASWVRAQNEHDLPGYLAAYDHTRFKGIKRTHRGGVKTYDFAGWRADRAPMLPRTTRVAAVGATYESWLERGSKLRPGLVVVRFIQRWESPSYADHGVKVLHLTRGSDGKLRIVYEDLLNSDAGWDVTTTTTAAMAITPAKDDIDARKLWAKLAPTGASYEAVLRSIPDDDAVRHPLAREILVGGNFKCDKTVTISECGDERVEWADLDPKERIGDPCLRRRLLIWALTAGKLTRADFVDALPLLREIVALEPPEDELQPLVLAHAGKQLDAPTRHELLLLAPPDVAGRYLDGLTRADLATLALRGHVDEAALELARDGRDKDAIGLLVVDAALTAATRRMLFQAVAGWPATESRGVLYGIARYDDDCALAMDAALELARQGDGTSLPSWQKGASIEELGRALCLLVHDRDLERQHRTWRAFLRPTGSVSVITARRGDHETDEVTERFQRKSAGFELDDDFGHSAPECTGDTCSGANDYSVSFVTIDGASYVSSLTRVVWTGCGC